MSGPHARRRAAALLLSLPLLSLAPHQPRIPLPGARPECPMTDFAVPVYRRGQIVRYDKKVVAASGPITDIPEFHDCQRFVASDGSRYDSLHAIFAARDLDSVVARAIRLGGASARAFTAATIYSWEGRYAPLRIAPRFNCLYLWHDGKTLQAFMLAVGDADARCLETRDPPPSDSPLRLAVRPVPAGVYPGSAIPPVARWEWDATRNEQFIGLKCGAAWCEISRGGASAEPPAVTASMDHGQRRVRELKGWNDQQWLARRVTGSGAPRVVPSKPVAAVIPHPRLGEQTVSDFRKGWVPVATIHLDADVPGYAARHNFTPGDNQLWLRDDPATQYAPRPADVPGTWWAMVVSSTNVRRYFAVTRRDHRAEMAKLGLTMPPTARWRWLAEDETVWIRCDVGCCEVELLDG